MPDVDMILPRRMDLAKERTFNLLFTLEYCGSPVRRRRSMTISKARDWQPQLLVRGLVRYSKTFKTFK